MKPLPCPFCGGRATFRWIDDSDEPAGGWHSLGCRSRRCAPGPVTFGDTKTEALEKWNTRGNHAAGESDHRDAARRTLQPIAMGEDGRVRFKKNAVVNFLHEHGGFDMNALAAMAGPMGFSNEDRAQFAQLIGYSVSGWGELNYVELSDAHVADAIADQIVEDTAKTVKLSKAERKALEMVAAAGVPGCDIVSPACARVLRDLHTRAPHLFQIIRDRPSDSVGMKPFFGVSLNATARTLLAKKGGV